MADLSSLSFLQDMDDPDEGFEQGDCSSAGQPDDLTLPPLLRVQKYAQASNIFDRQMVSRIVQEFFSTIPAENLVEDLPQIMKILISNGEDSAVKADFLDQIPHIAEAAYSAKFSPNDLKTILSDYLIPFVVRNLGCTDATIDKAAHSTLLQLIQHGFISKQQAEIQVCPSVLALSKIDNFMSENVNASAITLMCKMAPYLGRDVTERVFLKRFAEMCSNDNFCARKACASHFGEICAVVGRDAFEKILLPCYIMLCEDERWGVRKSCAEVIMFVSSACSPEGRRSILAPIFIKLLEDGCRWVKMSAFQTLGPFISTFADPSITKMAYNVGGDLVLVNGDGSEFLMSRSSDEMLSRMQRENLNDESYQRNAFFYDCHKMDQNRSSASSSFYFNPTNKINNNNISNNSNSKDLNNDDSNMIYELDNIFSFNKPILFNKLPPAAALLSSSSSSSNSNLSTNQNNNYNNNSGSQHPQLIRNQPFTGDDDEEDEIIDSTVTNQQNDKDDNTFGLKDILDTLMTGKIIDAHELLSNNQSESAIIDSEDVNQKNNNSKRTEEGADDENVDAQAVEKEMQLVCEAIDNLTVQHQLLDNQQQVILSKLENGTNNEQDDSLHLYNSYNYWYISPDLPLDPNIVSGTGGQLHGFTDIELNLKDLNNRNDNNVERDKKLNLFNDESRNKSAETSDITLTASEHDSNNDSENENLKAVVNKSPAPPEQDVVPQLLIDHFISMTCSNIYLNVDNDIPLHCAYSLPAVALTLGRDNWHLLSDTVDLLANDMQYKVRLTVASGLHELAVILGPDMASEHLTPLFEGFLKDVDEVKYGVLKHLAHFLSLISPAKRTVYLPKLQEFLHMDNEGIWRLRALLAKQLLLSVPLFRPHETAKHIGIIAQDLLTDKVAAVRQNALKLITEVLKYISSEQVLTSHLLIKLAERFAHSKKWKLRQIFAMLCGEIIAGAAIPHEVFATDVMPHLLDLSWDPVANVRLVVARTISKHIIVHEYFSDQTNQHYDSLDAVLRRLQADKDRDVRESAEIVETDVPSPEKGDAGTPSESGTASSDYFYPYYLEVAEHKNFNKNDQ